MNNVSTYTQSKTSYSTTIIPLTVAILDLHPRIVIAAETNYTFVNAPEQPCSVLDPTHVGVLSLQESHHHPVALAFISV